jgi:hypothetical protein
MSRALGGCEMTPSPLCCDPLYARARCSMNAAEPKAEAQR